MDNTNNNKEWLTLNNVKDFGYRGRSFRMSRSGDQLGVERGRVSQIADRSAVETATGHRTTVGDSHNSKGLEP